MTRVAYWDRFWDKVDARGVCWEWTAARTGGYGRIKIGGTGRLAHRVAYELLVGPIPDGLTVDHRCINTGCVNPDHFEIVPQSVNSKRSRARFLNLNKTTCVNGHPYDDANTYIRRTGRGCRQCGRAATARYRQRKNNLNGRVPA